MIFRGVLNRGGNSCAVPSLFVPVGGGGLGPPPLTQSGNGAAFDDVAPLDLIAALFFLGAIVEEKWRRQHRLDASFLARPAKWSPAKTLQ